jgi:hypothetical protein
VATRRRVIEASLLIEMKSMAVMTRSSGCFPYYSALASLKIHEVSTYSTDSSLSEAHLKPVHSISVMVP